MFSRRSFDRSGRDSRLVRSTFSLPQIVRVLGMVGVGVILAAAVEFAQPSASHRGSVGLSSRAARSRAQRQVAALFGGIPQDGVVLGSLAAPVTLQVFLDLEDYADATNWLDFDLPPILTRFVRTNLVRLEFHSFKTDTLNGGPFVTQQTAAMAAGAQDRLWDYAATFLGEQGREFTNYANEAFVTGIAEQVPGLNIPAWERSRTVAMSKIVMADNYDARHQFGFYATPAFRIGLTGGRSKDFSGRTVTTIPKYIVRQKSSGERYVAGRRRELQHPVSLIDASDLKRAIEELCRTPGASCPPLAGKPR